MKPAVWLLPLSWLYGAGVALRNWFFDTGFLPGTKVSVPVVSVGNISAGGSGKTPFVELVARLLRNKGKKVAIVSRGYGRKSRGFQVVSNGRQRCAEAFTAGDEPAMLSEHLNDVIVVVDENRVRGARNVLESFKPDIIVLDDGFQHRFLRRDVDIVLLTEAELRTRTRLLPAGYRREPVGSLKRANMIVVSQCGSLQSFEEAKERLPKGLGKPVIGSRASVVRIDSMGSDRFLAPADFEGRNVGAFSGIGDPMAFDRTLHALKAEVIFHHRFPDHHWYTPADVELILRVLEKSAAEILVTTEKDAVRLETLDRALIQKMPVYVVKIEASLLAGEEILGGLLDSL